MLQRLQLLRPRPWRPTKTVLIKTRPHRTTLRSAPSLFRCRLAPFGDTRRASGRRNGAAPQYFQISDRVCGQVSRVQLVGRQAARSSIGKQSCQAQQAMAWSHTHFDGYELLAVPSDAPASIVILDSSALVLVQRVLLPAGDAPPRALTWQPGGASTGCSSGALSCIVSTRGGRLLCQWKMLSARVSIHEA